MIDTIQPQERLKELRQLISECCTHAQIATAVPGLTLLRSQTVTSSPVQVIYKPMVCLIAQGRKQVILGGTTYEYDSSKYLISSVDLPVSGIVSEASAERPYLALSLTLDQEVLSGLLLEMSLAIEEGPVPCALGITQLTPELLEAFVRLLRLLHRPSEIRLLAPLIVREILFRLLTGDQASMLRQIAVRNSQTQQVVRAINWIRQNYEKPFCMGELLRVSNMSAPTLHRHFKAVTAMSPLQYQKKIRLHEARRLLISQKENAAAVGFSVGYRSPSQFSREYNRLFGAPPRVHASSYLND